MDKTGTTYRYNPSFHSHLQHTMQKNNNKSSLSRPLGFHEDDSQTCFCFESDDDSADKIRFKNTKRKLARGCMSNLMICAILIGYTFIGAVIFLIVEGDSGFYSISSRSKIHSVTGQNRRPASNATWLARISEESRAKTVENIWDITVSLNILYRENWTRLAAQEITRFQEQLVQKLTEEMASRSYSHDPRQQKVDWNLAKAFLYSLTVLTTIGYGNITPRTTLGKAVTMGYAALGIPLMLIYLSSMGSLLSNCARHIFTRSLCCCLCSNCGYCCYDEKRMQEKERRMRKKREQKEYEQQLQTIRHHQEPFYVRSPSSTFTTSTSNNMHSPVRVESDGIKLDSECLSADTSVLETKPGASCLAPLTLCFLIMITYICGGAVILCRLESSWSFLDSIFFCFMTLSTIGFGDSIPSASVLSTKIGSGRTGGSLIIWFCSLYILAGMALTAMCFNVVHDEIVHKLKHHYTGSSLAGRMTEENSVSTKLGSSSNFLDGETTVNTTIDYPPTS
ncbi:TWiK family of potassium channels protein 7-like [Macrosteles quadrilineatus]|uniref:TWiK family of potassium channels protein 7-like n=1 Tax=Macrosteles quadrilineatus TaxID=74068 RepID=UPI0023E1639F|nr:TWiK family of potassium channels protein 7-like [Macrosteles quadrilineatus]XP_054290578.1 TWiK family of potassium channels protein 7-like [Macrosteles quadrilineatus]